MTELRQVFFVTSNPNKVTELNRMLGMMVSQKNIDLPEIQSMDVSAVAKQKARDAYKIVQSSIMVEDSGLIVEAWGDFPGALIKWMTGVKYKTVGLEGFCKLVPAENRRACAISYFAIYDGKSWTIGTGRIKGIITETPRGKHGFGWDSIFIPNGSDKTFAEMGAVKKDACSARRLAIEDLKKHLR